MSRRRRVRKRRQAMTFVAVIVAVSGLYVLEYWPFGGRGEREGSAPEIAAQASREQGGGEAFVSLAVGVEAEGDGREAGSGRGEVKKPRPARPAALGDKPLGDLSSIRRAIEEGLNARSAGDLLGARELLKGAVGAGLGEAEASVVRAALVDIADRTIFGPERIEGDPLTGTHAVQSGEVLDRIAKSYGITAGLLARINRIADKNRIRMGQRLKVVHGPFHAVVNRSRYMCEVFLGDVLVAEFRVGLGEFGSTPTGEWVVKDKLTNPTYYPPASRGGAVMAAEDPKNPLGEYWIGLKGVSGEAVGQYGYGIHGTIEPDSIGRSVSLGCVRLLDEDIEMLFGMLTVSASRVIVE